MALCCGRVDDDVGVRHRVVDPGGAGAAEGEGAAGERRAACSASGGSSAA